jgi:hypothetical protein
MRVCTTACECPRRDSNPCYRLERPASWASRRRGPSRAAPRLSEAGHDCQFDRNRRIRRYFFFGFAISAMNAFCAFSISAGVRSFVC